KAAKSHVSGIVVIGEGEGVAGVEPAVVIMAALRCRAGGQHTVYVTIARSPDNPCRLRHGARRVTWDPMDITKDPVIAALDGLRVIVRALRASAYSAERGLGVSGAQLFVLREIESEP